MIRTQVRTSNRRCTRPVRPTRVRCPGRLASLQDADEPATPHLEHLAAVPRPVTAPDAGSVIASPVQPDPALLDLAARVGVGRCTARRPPASRGSQTSPWSLTACGGKGQLRRPHPGADAPCGHGRTPPRPVGPPPSRDTGRRPLAPSGAWPRPASSTRRRGLARSGRRRRVRVPSPAARYLAMSSSGTRISLPNISSGSSVSPT